MKNERQIFQQQSINLALTLSPIQKWSLRQKFPNKLILSLILIILTTTRSYFYTQILSKQAQTFIRSMNFIILNHTDTDVYFMDPFMVDLPIQTITTINNLQQHWNQLSEYMKNLNYYTAGFVNQQYENDKQRKSKLHFINGSSKEYSFNLSNGIKEPFDWNEPQEIRQIFVQIKKLELVFDKIRDKIEFSDYSFQQQWIITMEYINYHEAAFKVQIKSDFNYIITNIQNGNQQLPTAPFRIIMAYNSWIHSLLIILASILYLTLHIRSFIIKFKLVKTTKQSKKYTQLPWLQCLTAITNIAVAIFFIFSTSQNFLNKIAGISAGLSWFCLTTYMSNIKNQFYIRLLLQKSPPLLFRWIVSSIPLYLGMGLLAHILFARYSYQFQTWYDSCLSLFYIAYYNMNYQQMAETQRSRFNLIFYLIFTVIFTYVVFGSLLVAMLLQFTWDKAQQKRVLDLIVRLKIICPKCDSKYQYILNNNDSQLLQNQFGSEGLSRLKGNRRIQQKQFLYHREFEINNFQQLQKILIDFSNKLDFTTYKISQSIQEQNIGVFYIDKIKNIRKKVIDLNLKIIQRQLEIKKYYQS